MGRGLPNGLAAVSGNNQALGGNTLCSELQVHSERGLNLPMLRCS